MQKSFTVILVATLTLSACNSWRESRVNPSNWFGSSTPAAPTESVVNDANALVPDTQEGGGLFSRSAPEDTSVPIAKIDELRIDPTPTGAIVYASGTAIRQGAYNARLVRVDSEENQENSVLEFTFRVNYPARATNTGTERSRKVSDAINISQDDLQNTRLVRVVGQQNALESRRR
ncbi:hypothetical protein RUE5091_01397 [Ruegeria denitrificans]|uniref:Lipoprotein n=1 Tax=Ruegeria denitrificans TaxID=1715692 RepID=A0A0P1I709_9RHOB|nr:hypothetical protein [Ruegeria denitrificans]CUJ94233.1 hypothetical protein RUE5091_01397 [Ruegeria denitrificans]